MYKIKQKLLYVWFINWYLMFGVWYNRGENMDSVNRPFISFIKHWHHLDNLCKPLSANFYKKCETMDQKPFPLVDDADVNMTNIYAGFDWVISH